MVISSSKILSGEEAAKQLAAYAAVDEHIKSTDKIIGIGCVAPSVFCFRKKIATSSISSARMALPHHLVRTAAPCVDGALRTLIVCNVADYFVGHSDRDRQFLMLSSDYVRNLTVKTTRIDGTLCRYTFGFATSVLTILDDQVRSDWISE